MAEEIIQGVIAGIKIAVFLALFIYVGLILKAFRLRELWPMMAAASMLLLSGFIEFVYIVGKETGSSPFSLVDSHFLSGILMTIAATGIFTMFYFISAKSSPKRKK
ncbi:hypothetical protein HYS54_02180 [Candidatus Micrarchaeota archaeon]|nr:hypothetical protein [Candidatus Micrarchaeota archaeon]